MFLKDDNGYLEILIYGLAMVAGLIANAYRNYAKRKAKENQTPSGEKTETSYPGTNYEPEEEPVIPGFPEYIFEEPEEEPVIETRSVETVEVKEPLTVEAMKAARSEDESALIERAQQLLEEDTPVELRDSIGAEMESAFAVPDIDPQGIEYTDDEKEFDLETAVIYSEILNAKYINNSY